MKKIFLAAVAIAVSMYAGGVSASAQSLKDLLGSTVKDAVETAITGGAVTPQKISGTWAYSGCAVGFESENMLKNVAAKAAASQLEGKVNTYLEKIGLKNGTFSYTFNADNTFSTTFKGKSFDGTYEISEDGSRITMKYGKSLKLMSMTAVVTVTSSELNLMFDADKLLTFIGKISATSSNATLKTLSTLASQYDGMNIGFKLKK